jgi:hypothetical protein
MEDLIEFTEGQKRAIANGIVAGRGALARIVNGEPVVAFIAAFAEAGGVQCPGRDLTEEETKRVAAHVVKSFRGRHSFHDEPEHVREVCYREINRAYSESNWFSAAQHADCVGFRLMVTDNAGDPAECRRIATIDLGLGPGIWPKNRVVVLPVCCDRTYWEAVFADELAKLSLVVPDDEPGGGNGPR